MPRFGQTQGHGMAQSALLASVKDILNQLYLFRALSPMIPLHSGDITVAHALPVCCLLTAASWQFNSSVLHF